MATPLSEGTSSRLCELCAGNPSSKYCRDCHGALCSYCATKHHNTNLFKDHKIVDHSDSASASGACVAGLVKCFKHTDNVLDLYCTTCKRFLCEGCKPDHGHNTIKPATGDTQLYKEAYRKYMQDLLAEVHRLEEQKLRIEIIMKSCDVSIEIVDMCETQLIEYIRQRADARKKELRLAKNKYESYLTDGKHGIDKSLDEAYSKLNELNSLRKVSDTEVITHELATTQALLDELTKTIDRVTDIPKVKIGDKLSKNKQVNAVKDVVDDVFNTGGSCMFDIDSNKRIVDIAIPNPNGENGYRISRSTDCDNIILHGKNRSDIRVLNCKTHNVISQHTSDVNIWHMVTTVPGQHVAINNAQDSLYLLDQQFKIVSTSKTNSKIFGVDFMSHHRFVKCEVRKAEPHKAYISIIFVHSDKLVLVSEVATCIKTEPYYMAVHPDKLHVSFCQDKSVQEVCLINSSSTEHALAQTDHAFSFHIDGQRNTWIADEQDTIHLYDR